MHSSRISHLKKIKTLIKKFSASCIVEGKGACCFLNTAQKHTVNVLFALAQKSLQIEMGLNY